MKKEIRVGMLYERIMPECRFWEWVDLTIRQINEGRKQRMIALGQLHYEHLTREDFQKLVQFGGMILEDDLGSFGKLKTIFSYEELPEKKDDNGTRSSQLSEPPTQLP